MFAEHRSLAAVISLTFSWLQTMPLFVDLLNTMLQTPTDWATSFVLHPVDHGQTWWLFLLLSSICFTTHIATKFNAHIVLHSFTGQKLSCRPPQCYFSQQCYPNALCATGNFLLSFLLEKNFEFSDKNSKFLSSVLMSCNYLKTKWTRTLILVLHESL